MVMYGIKHSHFFGSGSKPVSHCYHAYTVRYTCKGTLQQPKIKLLSFHDTWSHNCSISLNSATRNWYLILKTWKINKPSIYLLYSIIYMNGTTWREFKKTTTIFFLQHLQLSLRPTHPTPRDAQLQDSPRSLQTWECFKQHLDEPWKTQPIPIRFLMSFTKIHHERFWVFFIIDNSTYRI